MHPSVIEDRNCEADRLLDRNIAALARRRREEQEAAGPDQRIARAITRFTGSMRSVYLHLLLFGGWIVINSGLIAGIEPFDPTLVVLAMIASVEAIFLSTFVLISQNRLAAAADRRADLDLQISLLAEHEVAHLARMVTAIAERLGVEAPAGDDPGAPASPIRPEAVLDEIEAATPPEA